MKKSESRMREGQKFGKFDEMRIQGRGVGKESRRWKEKTMGKKNNVELKGN